MIKILYLSLLLLSKITFAKDELGFEIIDINITNKLPFVTLQVEDKKLEFLLDTGARNKVLVVDKNIVTDLKTLIEFPRQSKGANIAGKSFIGREYILPKFNIGLINFTKVRLAEDTNWGLSTSGDTLKKDGVVGLELFEDKAIIIDYPKQKLIIMNGKIPNGKP
jgi:hypothetical protein